MSTGKLLKAAAPVVDIFETLRSAADPGKAASMCAYMRGQFPFLGISAPKRRNLSRDFLKTFGRQSVDWNFIFECWRQLAREFQYLVKDYWVGVKTLLTPSDIPDVWGLVLHKFWWDTVDGLDVIVGDVALHHPEVNDALSDWSVDENIWLRHLVINHQLTRREKTSAPLFERILVNNFGQTEFFIIKAIGWVLRNYSKTNPDWVRNFIERHRGEMTPLSIREADRYV
jgi:3-methyladenine DNA glycosylase AlkD